MLNQYKVTVEQDVKRALIEDLEDNYNATSLDACSTNNIAQLCEQDITAMLIPASTLAKAKIITRDDIVLCGRAWAETAFTLVQVDIELTWHYKDGDKISANSILVEISGNARAILTAERTALNFLQLLSATATTSAYYVSFLQNSHTKLLDTRKTIPSLRQAQKYAVACGGGKNHRMGLFDAFLIKENHISACGSIHNAVLQAKQMHPTKPVEVEVESLDELQQAITAGADIVMLDNFSTQQIQQAVSINKQQCKLEVSGNITETRLAELAATGVDFVSSGAITKNVVAVDLSLLIL